MYIYSSSDSVTAFDDQSSSLIKLNNSTVLYLREVNKFLALVCILREYSFSRQGVIDFNFLCFREAIHKVFEVRTMKKLAINDSLYDDEDDDDDVVDDEEDEDDDDLDRENDRDDVEDDDDDSRPSIRLQRYDSDDELKLNDSRVNNQHFVRSATITNH